MMVTARSATPMQSEVDGSTRLFENSNKKSSLAALLLVALLRRRGVVATLGRTTTVLLLAAVVRLATVLAVHVGVSHCPRRSREVGS